MALEVFKNNYDKLRLCEPNHCYWSAGNMLCHKITFASIIQMSRYNVALAASLVKSVH